MPQALPADLEDQVRRALEEDVGNGDLTAALLPEHLSVSASLVAREAAVLCGTAWFDETFRQLDPGITVAWQAQDGDAVSREQELCRLAGPARAILTGERTAMNFLQTLSATATVTRRYATELEGFECRLLDTRKTLPGLRSAQKFATACGGATNHRMGLHDAILIKENHILAAGSIAAALQQAQRLAPEGTKIEVEVENLAEVDRALEAGAEFLLLDNFSTADLREAVARNSGRAKLEASGNIELDTLKEIAATGVNFVSVGALTKHLRAVDLSLRIQ